MKNEKLKMKRRVGFWYAYQSVEGSGLNLHFLLTVEVPHSSFFILHYSLVRTFQLMLLGVALGLFGYEAVPIPHLA